MPIAKVRMPNGRIGKFNVPEGTTPEEVVEFARDNADEIMREETSFFEELKNNVLTGSEAFNIKFEQRGRGIQQALLSAAGALGFDTEEREELLAKRQKASQERFEQLPEGLARGVSGFVGDIAPLAVTAPIAPQNIAGLFAGGAAEGLTRGSEEVLDVEERGLQSGLAGVTGTVGGLALQGAGKLGSKAIKAGSEKLGAILGKPRQSLQSVLDDTKDGIEYASAIDKVREALGDEAARLQTLIGGRVDDQGNKIGKGLFDIAKSRGKKAFVKKEGMEKLAKTIKEKQKNEIDPDAERFLSRAARKIEEISESGKVTVNELEGLRRAASSTSNSAIGTTRNAAGEVVDAVDDFLSEGFRSGQITGDKKAVSLWNKAIKTRREFGQKFEKPKEIAAALSDDTIEDIERKFVGGASPSRARSAAKVYDNVLKALPERQKDQAGFLMRQSVVNKMVRQSADKIASESDAISAKSLASEIKSLRNNNKSLWSKFPTDEKKDLLTLEKELRSLGDEGAFDKVKGFVANYVMGATGHGLEVPRTMAVKRVVDVKDLLDIARTKPKPTENFKPLLGAVSSAAASEEIQ